MSILQKLSSQLPAVQKSEVRKEVAAMCLKSPKETANIIHGLQSSDEVLQGDCAEILAEMAIADPSSIAPYAEEIIAFLYSSNNRVLWHILNAINHSAHLFPHLLYSYRDKLMELSYNDSIIVRDNAIKVLGNIAATNSLYGEVLTDFFTDILRTCRPSDLPRYAEFIIPALGKDQKQREAISRILSLRLDELKHAPVKRIEKIIEALTT